MKIFFLVAHVGSTDDWAEDYVSDDTGTPEEIIGRLLDSFNATLRPSERPRRLVKIISVEGSAPQR